MAKTHFSIDPANSIAVACGRFVNEHGQTPFTAWVTCGTCKSRASFKEQEVKDKAAKIAAFEASTPRKMTEPWHQGNVPMVCKDCGNDTFREADRTCYGHYANYVCAACGGTESRLTETGMSF